MNAHGGCPRYVGMRTKNQVVRLCSAARGRQALALGISAFAALLLIGSVQGQETGAAGPPCDASATRSVGPSTVYAGDTVTMTTAIQAYCGDAKPRGIDVMFVVDRSITVHEDGLLDSIQTGLTNFVLAMDFESSTAGLITYARQDQIATNLTHDQSRVLNAIRSIRLSEENDVRGVDGAFRKAVGKLDNDGDPANQKVVFITVAGVDQSQALVNMPTVTNSARNAGVKVIFLLFPQARYRHLVEAASDCTSNCPTYQLGSKVATKWAWPVDERNYAETTSMLATRLLRARAIDRIVHEEYLHSGAVLVPGSVSPPATQVGQRLLWDLAGVPARGLTLTYRARMIYPNETYPVADSAVLEVVDDLGENHPIAVDNPDIEVLDPALRPTPVPSATATPEATPTAAATDTPTATPTETSTTVVVHLPIAYR